MPSRQEMLSMLGALFIQREHIDDAISRLRRDIDNNPIHRDPEAHDNPIIDEARVLRTEDLPIGFRYMGGTQKPADPDEDLAAAVADTLADGPEMRPLAHHMQPDGEPVAGAPAVPSYGDLAAAGLSAQEIALIRAKRRGEQLQATPIDADAPVKPYDVSEPYHGDREQQAQIEQQRRAAQNATAGTPRVSPINSGGVNGQLATRWKDKPAENGIRTRG